jgi:predicted amidohydrolase YtcJ
MTEAADRIFTGGWGHTLTDPDETHAAVAVRDGEIVRVGKAYEVQFLAGVETEVVDLDGRTLLPGFVDAHTHMEVVGHYEMDADLAGADGPDECIDRLSAVADVREELILGFGYDESEWTDARYLTRADLDAVSESRPVVAFREDMHLASLNGVAFDHYRDAMPAADVRTEDGEPTGVVVEDAAAAVWEAIEPPAAELRDQLVAARDRAHKLGITAVHDMVRRPEKPRIYRELDLADALRLRVRLNYWSDFLDAVVETGLRRGHGSEFVRTGAIKTYTDGSIGGQTAKLSAPYEDADTTGQWVVDPEELAAFADRVDGEGLQAAVHAIGDEAIAAVVDSFEGTGPDRRHRVEHAEVLTDELVERLGASGLVVSAQPNFLKWAREDGLYESRLGVERTRDSNRFRALLDAGARLAFGSDCMPLGPLFGVDQAVTAPDEDQRLDVTEALQAYTREAAYAGFDEDRLGTVEPGKRADLVVLEESPWEADDIAAIDVAMTVVDGEIVHDGR